MKLLNREKNFNTRTVNGLLGLALSVGGELMFKDGEKRWVLKKVKEVHAEDHQHDWEFGELDEELNCFLERHCRHCPVRERWLTSVGEWKEIPDRKEK